MAGINGIPMKLKGILYKINKLLVHLLLVFLANESTKLATSPAILNRRMGHVDSLDRTSNGHYAERPFHLDKIMPEVHGFLHLNPSTFGKICL
jgi:hypothetical protein